ncbi:hypothetical protein LB516_23295 [Mesorhizobium sp. CO1-1-7]|uniref:hypothetical protein n=1 Tax=unclassified Mesorhizobium TaxID=325217 RepID=UPI00112D1271|nr:MULTISPECIES: hypothetical protein [unclassified Mesorhizobium]MBZ9929535.1 hypothetical protein [Mesorhizobium sp. BR1-1-5]MBZ9748167.1 hypothetical protein [Mesorhizobium sp. CO1-1-7]MBZ9905394.1 hypothetical protein [Mesorhizobium sp. BR115XR7A]TPJ12150.1 hypothetical protein FJW04_23080 [Mesorhizobium sp. B2-7-3]TPL99521.1 hypothetical protein FJ943_13750 [Mesorhizobium sp. B2-3-10]
MDGHFELELAKARLSVSQAESDLKRLERITDKRYGVGIDLALCDTIRGAQRRVGEARAHLTRIKAGKA